MVDKKVTINGKAYKAKAVENLRIFLEKLGFKGFGLCHSESIISSARCDLCLVKVGGKITRSCEYFVSDDIEVVTEDDELKQVRVTNFEILVSGHKTDCERCHQNGLCNLQSFSRNHNKSFPQDVNLDQEDDIDDLHEEYYLDHRRCINCSLCVDFSKKIFKDGFFSKVSRGKYSRVSSNLINRDNVDLGKYRDLCPTGAIHHKLDKRIGARSHWAKVDCVGCEQKCELLARTIDNRYLDIRTQEGQLDLSCEAGRLWWQSLDFWNPNPPIMRKITNDRSVSVYFEELTDIIPQNLKWSLLLAPDLYPNEQKFWSSFQDQFETGILSTTSDDYLHQIGPSGLIENTSFKNISSFDQLEAVILIEPLWKLKPDFIAEIKSKSKFLVLISFSDSSSPYADLQVERNSWMLNYKVLPTRQKPNIEGIMELIKQKAGV